MLTRAVETYLAVRRAAGFVLRDEEAYLKSFAAFSKARKQRYVSAKVAIEWAALAQSRQQRARKLGMVIRLARYLRAENERHEVPPAFFGSEKSPRPTPYILTPKQIQQLMTAALHTRRPFCGATYSTLFGLLACTGLRVAEATHLRFGEITSDGLIIRRTKFHKSRLVPLHQTAEVALERYVQQRRRHVPSGDHVFVSLRRNPLSVDAVRSAFETAVKQAGLSSGSGGVRPTSRSLRHTFAVRALETCPNGRDAVTKHMLALSTYLGHSSVANTYWYLEAVPELMRDIADRAEQFARFAMKGQA